MVWLRMLDGDSFNMSPLRGLDGVTYVTNAAQLTAALGAVHRSASGRVDDFFFMHAELPRWQALLGRPRVG